MFRHRWYPSCQREAAVRLDSIFQDPRVFIATTVAAGGIDPAPLAPHESIRRKPFERSDAPTSHANADLMWRTISCPLSAPAAGGPWLAGRCPSTAGRRQ